jgi:hypothetical protein
MTGFGCLAFLADRHSADSHSVEGLCQNTGCGLIFDLVENSLIAVYRQNVCRSNGFRPNDVEPLTRLTILQKQVFFVPDNQEK